MPRNDDSRAVTSASDGRSSASRSPRLNSFTGSHRFQFPVPARLGGVAAPRNRVIADSRVWTSVWLWHWEDRAGRRVIAFAGTLNKANCVHCHRLATAVDAADRVSCISLAILCCLVLSSSGHPNVFFIAREQNSLLREKHWRKLVVGSKPDRLRRFQQRRLGRQNNSLDSLEMLTDA